MNESLFATRRKLASSVPLMTNWDQFKFSVYHFDLLSVFYIFNFQLSQGTGSVAINEFQVRREFFITT